MNVGCSIAKRVLAKRCSAAVLKSDEFQNATPYNKAFFDTMFMVKDFWATPEYAAILDQFNQRIEEQCVLRPRDRWLFIRRG